MLLCPTSTAHREVLRVALVSCTTCVGTGGEGGGARATVLQTTSHPHCPSAEALLLCA